MTTASIRRTVVLMLVAAQGCMYIPASKGGRGIELVTDRSRVNKNTGDNRAGGFGPKAVTGKREPTRLIARDGTSCVVSEKKFQSTALGTSVWCTWFDTDR
jgi:hypothetical protein